MKFFLPDIDEPQMAEEAYAKIRTEVAKFAKAPLARPRYFRLDYSRNEERLTAQVGHFEPLEGQKVLAIFKETERDVFYVCTPNRGATSGSPILVGERDLLAPPVQFE